MINVQLDKLKYEPGEQIQGKVTWKQITPDISFEIRLIWFTLGKGSRDYAEASNQTIEHPSEEGVFEFSFEAPDWPHSFSGELISLQWAVEVIVLPTEESVEVELVIAPGGHEIVLPRESNSEKQPPLSRLNSDPNSK